MAIYTSYEIKPQYYTSAVGGYNNGADDQRHVSNNYCNIRR